MWPNMSTMRDNSFQNDKNRTYNYQKLKKR